jgi:predicted nicotinamide N-methyase
MTGDSARERRLARLRARLGGEFALKEMLVTIPRAGCTYAILTPSDHDRLLDEAEADPEQHLPYWAEIWPSGIALADVALARADELAGRAVLELGSGLGITAAAALEAGADLLAADYSAVSLTLCRYNSLHNAGREPRTIEINWRDPPQDLLDRADAIRGYPVILAADVLYETRDIAPLLAITARLLARDGGLWLAEPGRDAARRFLAAATELGWQRASETQAGPWADGTSVSVGVHFLRRPA